MYADFQMCTSKISCEDTQQEDELYEQFDKVYQALSIMYKDKNSNFFGNEYDQEALDKLEQLSISAKLKNCFKDLVDKYLTLKSKDKKNRKDYLVIKIDDLDMNTDNGFDMAEEIRKYLMIPNVILLIALNLEQMEKFVERNYVGFFDPLMKHDLYNTSEVIKLASKYILKLIPNSRRVYMPELNIDFYTETKYTSDKIYINNAKKEAKEQDNTVDKGKNEADLIDIIFKKLYVATGLMFLCDERGKHPLIPTNLRELVYLNHMLDQMIENVRRIDELKKEDQTDNDLEYDTYENNISFLAISQSKKQEEYKKVLRDNLNEYKHYFMDNLVSINLEFEDVNFIKSLLNQDASRLNKHVASYLVRKYFIKKTDETPDLEIESKSDQQTSEEDLYILNLSNIESYYGNISIADIFYTMQRIENRYIDSYVTKFLSYIRSYYSIRFMEEIFIKPKKEEMDTEHWGAEKTSENDQKVYWMPRPEARRMFGDSFLRANYYKKESSTPFHKLFTRIDGTKTLSDYPMAYDKVFNLVILQYGKNDSKKIEKNNYISNYEKKILPGATTQFDIDVLSFILNMIDLSIVEDRMSGQNKKEIIEKTDKVLFQDLKKFSEKSVTILPIWSMDYLYFFYRWAPRYEELASKTDKNMEKDINIFQDFGYAVSRIQQSIGEKNEYVELEDYFHNEIMQRCFAHLTSKIEKCINVSKKRNITDYITDRGANSLAGHGNSDQQKATDFEHENFNAYKQKVPRAFKLSDGTSQLNEISNVNSGADLIAKVIQTLIDIKKIPFEVIKNHIVEILVEEGYRGKKLEIRENGKVYYIKSTKMSTPKKLDMIKAILQATKIPNICSNTIIYFQ